MGRGPTECLSASRQDSNEIPKDTPMFPWSSFPIMLLWRTPELTKNKWRVSGARSGELWSGEWWSRELWSRNGVDSGLN